MNSQKLNGESTRNILLIMLTLVKLKWRFSRFETTYEVFTQGSTYVIILIGIAQRVCYYVASINTILYRKSACTSGSIYRKRISFISRFGAIVTFCQNFFYSPCVYIYIYVVRKANNTTFNIYNPSLLDKPALMA